MSLHDKAQGIEQFRAAVRGASGATVTCVDDRSLAIAIDGSTEPPFICNPEMTASILAGSSLAIAGTAGERIGSMKKGDTIYSNRLMVTDKPPPK